MNLGRYADKINVYIDKPAAEKCFDTSLIIFQLVVWPCLTMDQEAVAGGLFRLTLASLIPFSKNLFATSCDILSVTLEQRPSLGWVITQPRLGLCSYAGLILFAPN